MNDIVREDRERPQQKITRQQLNALRQGLDKQIPKPPKSNEKPVRSRMFQEDEPRQLAPPMFQRFSRAPEGMGFKGMQPMLNLNPMGRQIPRGRLQELAEEYPVKMDYKKFKPTEGLFPEFSKIDQSRIRGTSLSPPNKKLGNYEDMINNFKSSYTSGSPKPKTLQQAASVPSFPVEQLKMKNKYQQANPFKSIYSQHYKFDPLAYPVSQTPQQYSTYNPYQYQVPHSHIPPYQSSPSPSPSPQFQAGSFPTAYQSPYLSSEGGATGWQDFGASYNSAQYNYNQFQFNQPYELPQVQLNRSRSRNKFQYQNYPSLQHPTNNYKLQDDSWLENYGKYDPSSWRASKARLQGAINNRYNNPAPNKETLSSRPSVGSSRGWKYEQLRYF